MTYKESMQLEESIYDFIKTVLHEREKTTGRPVKVPENKRLELLITIDNLYYILMDCMK